MSSRLLVVDATTPRRTILRVKLLAARYEVDAVDSCDDALDRIKDTRPDLIILTASATSGDYASLCATLREKTATRGIPVLMLGGPDTSKARFEALDYGAEDVIPDPISEPMLLSRIRSLLRRATVMRDQDTQAETLRFMGFNESRAARIAPACVLLQSDNAHVSILAATLQAGLGQRVRTVPLGFVADTAQARARPDLVVVDATQGALDRARLSAHLADLQAREGSRGAAVLVLLSPQSHEMAALSFDLGADDVVVGSADAAELGHRAQRLLAQKARQDSLARRISANLQEAGRDSLTGLANRRSAIAQLERIVERAAQSGRDFAIILADIDRFKSVNNTFGHAAGDQVLAEVAQRLRAVARSADLVARIGGEEFLIAMPDTSLEEALSLANRMRCRIGETPFFVAGAPVNVTISLGVAFERVDLYHIASIDAVFEHADAALYSSKSKGRDRVSLARDPAAA